MTTENNPIGEQARRIFTQALGDTGSGECASDYHRGQTHRGIMLEWQKYIYRKIDRPHGDDSAADHPVELAWIGVLSIISDAGQQALHEHRENQGNSRTEE